MPQGRVLDSKKAQVLGAAVRRILKESGVWVHHPRMLQALAEKGAQVEAGSKHVRLTEELIDEVIALQAARGLVGTPDSLEAAPIYTVSMGFEITPLYYDCDAGKPRHPTQTDLESMVKLAQVLPEVTTVGAPLTLVGSSALFEPLESFLTVARLTDKPISAVSLLPAHNPYFAEFGEILGGDRSRYIGCGGWMTSPLCVSERAGELIRLGPEYGKTLAGAGSMVIAGLSGPVTRAGAIVVGAAEILGPWVGALALQPLITGFSGSAATGILDPRTSRGCFGGPEAAKQDVAICELFDHCFGGGVGVAGRGYVDGKVPGLQVTFEKVTKALYVACARGGAPRIGNPGLLDAGRAFSPVQYLLDVEMDQALGHLYKGLEVTEEEVALDTIFEATAEYGSSFIGLEHTAHHLRGELWLPQFMDRAANYPPGGEDLERQVVARANQRWKELVASYQPVSRPELGAIEEVVAKAKKELVEQGARRFLA